MAAVLDPPTGISIDYSRLREEAFFNTCDFSWILSDPEALAPVRHQPHSFCWALVGSEHVSAVRYLEEKEKDASARYRLYSARELINCLHEAYPRGRPYDCDPQGVRIPVGGYGAWASEVYEYIQEKGLGLEDEHNLYVGKRGPCVKDLNAHRVTMEDFMYFTDSDEIIEMLHLQPLMASMVVYEKFKDYKLTEYHCDTGKKPGALLSYPDQVYSPIPQERRGGAHAVLLVGYGYGTTPEKKLYYLIKNSWGICSGHSGFSRVDPSVIQFAVGIIGMKDWQGPP